MLRAKRRRALSKEQDSLIRKLVPDNGNKPLGRRGDLGCPTGLIHQVNLPILVVAL